jgi:catechol 2,3-dioxygenase-like lactoylglutathione lyase family enzyme
MQTPGFSHVVLTVSNIARSRAFYGDLLGFTIKDMKWEDVEMFTFPVGDVAVWVLTHKQLASGDRFSEFRVGLDHLAFKATDEAALRALADKLIAVGVDTKGVETYFTGNIYMAFRDPDNIQLEYWIDRATE